ncbi:MAG TPA: NrfD/PsrC family molybdoenzyme membrane anchor subunit [Terriglobales bacterium]|nr:NrfD/PsrC family molybdoenzyme membrane anchor subunit [Terriglobales bacterium]
MNPTRHIDETTVPPVSHQPPVLAPGHTFETITDKISSIVLTDGISLGWLALLVISAGVAGLLAIAATYLLYKGVGIWGINIPIGWGFAIVNFVWWIGIGHAGTLISAILLLLKQSWRNSINRFAEAMTLFAVMCAGLFPVLHTGRPWLAYWLFPYPNTMQVWPQFRSPLVWDVFAVSTYFTISLVFWYTGLVPDLATLRDSAKNKVARFVYGMLSLGWRGSARHWSRYETAYLLLAGLSTPLVLSVHTVVSFDFAVGIVPGWHTTIFPPYFVAGAIYSGFAMVLVLAIPIRAAYNLRDFITDRHLENCAKFMLATGLIVAYGYIIEGFIAWYGGNPYEINMFWNRMTGVYAPFYWGLIFCNIGFVNILWWPKIRKSPVALFFVSVVILIAMWLERFVIVVISLQKDFLVSSWGEYIPTRWDWATYIGTLGFFFAAFLLFIRVLPMISIFEMRDLLPASRPHEVEVHS